MLGNDFFEEFEKHSGNKFSDAQKKRIKDRLNEIIDYEPKVGVFGKTGAGKSSLCNALFGKKEFKVGHNIPTTREAQEVLLNLGGKGLKLFDLPGVGENQERNVEYGNLYSKLLPDLDVVLWVLKGDDRAYAEDERFYKNVVKPHIDQVDHPLVFFFVLNQVDKIEPYREWDIDNRKPGVNQLSNIDEKSSFVADSFGIPKVKIIPVSASDKYNLEALVDTIVHHLPKKKRVGFVRQLEEGTVSKETEKEIKKTLWEEIKEVICDVAEVVKDVAETVLDKVFEKADEFLKKLPWPFGK